MIPAALPDLDRLDPEALKALVVSMKAELATAKAKESAADALIAVDKARACIMKYREVRGGDPALHANMLKIDTEREALKAKAE